MEQIWIVEDDRTIREAMEVILKKEGFLVRSFRSAEEISEQDSQPDLMICDYKLPGKNGIDLIRSAKKNLRRWIQL